MADRHEIAEEIDRLAVHCRPPLMSVEDRATWTADWCEDLAEFPIEAIRQACQRWRHGTDRKFPLPGQLKPMVVMCMPRGSGNGQIDEPWKPLTDAQYAMLSLPEKIRHHRILAAEAQRKAGPMWRNGAPVTAEEMPDAWRIWTQKASDHYAEASRLQKFLKREQAA